MIEISEEGETKREKMTATDGPDDMGGLVTHIAHLVNWKCSIFVFIAYIIINSTTFIDRVLSWWSGAVDGRFPTEHGALIQAMMITVLFIVFSIVVNSGVI